MRHNEDTKICGDCNGKCCKGMPGFCLPGDFGLDASDRVSATERIAELLISGDYQVEWWVGEERNELFIRPATLFAKGRIFDGSWGGQCARLTDTGCSLPFIARPYECQHLKPSAAPIPCSMHHGLSKHTFAKRWAPFESAMDDAIAIYKTKG